MLTVKVTADLAPVRRLLNNMERQVKYATAVALTRTAQQVKKEEQAEIGRVFDRPTAWSRNALYMRPATKERLYAEVWLRGEYPGESFRSHLRPHIFGGVRPQKKFEALLQRARVLPAGWVTVPGKGAKLDGHGNQSRAELVQILSAVQAFPRGGVGYTMNRTAASKKRRGTKLRDIFFSSPELQQQAKNGGRLPWGVWERKRDGTIQCLLFFVRQATYRKRFAFFEIAQRTIAREFDRQFDSALRQAMATAR